ncbi:hypothetical protein [Azospirillum sp. TSO22-1]|uniref:hypothetical protein n=1 Tax=Azospirillum sp. TSO22-1 TaxID=716789 RepID=UPI000D60C23E|nr:hypothetical protein [Azospirillum sp. TSO22-1]PWC43848.1 hypothetical protein TSO221_19035 [Azospirillum sp. TSO22-1]
MTNLVLGEVLDKAHEGKPFRDILKLSPSALQGVTEKDAEALKSAFGIRTIEDMAGNKFFRLAQALVTMAAYER